MCSALRRGQVSTRLHSVINQTWKTHRLFKERWSLGGCGRARPARLSSNPSPTVLSSCRRSSGSTRRSPTVSKSRFFPAINTRTYRLTHLLYRSKTRRPLRATHSGHISRSHLRNGDVKRTSSPESQVVGAAAVHRAAPRLGQSQSRASLYLCLCTAEHTVGSGAVVLTYSAVSYAAMAPGRGWLKLLRAVCC